MAATDEHITAIPDAETRTVEGFAFLLLQTLAEHGMLDRGLKVRTMVLPVATVTVLPCSSMCSMTDSPSGL